MSYQCINQTENSQPLKYSYREMSTSDCLGSSSAKGGSDRSGAEMSFIAVTGGTILAQKLH